MATAFSLMTWNLWKTDGVPTAWHSRRPVVVRALQKPDPDMLLVQELHPQITDAILEALPGHTHIEDEFEGWTQEGNIFYRKRLFREVAHGSDDIGQKEPLRRLFWARFSCQSSTMLVATAHLTWPGHPSEWETDENLRKAQTRRMVEALDTRQLPREPCFVGGDFNESFWPKMLLTRGCFVSCFSALGLPERPTHPMRPTLAHEDQNADAALDWLFARSSQEGEGAGCAKPLLASVVDDMCALSSDDPSETAVLSVAPSDHRPVMAVYRI